ncbi:MAG: hypothetical protein HY821_22860, partial [Acidobacteria bacterium]|nr:hypothetical protein [Acidobacteriota bacterium]
MSDPQFPPPQGNPQPNYVLPPHNDGGGQGVKMAILFGAVVVLIAANVYLYLQIDGLKQEMAKNRESMVAEVGRVKETSAVTTAAAQKHMDDLRDELESARKQAA